jgi:NDP-sugar pyrophosphorylase family protein
VRALILAAGLGTRLYPLTLVRAKAAVPVNGTPLVCRTVAWLAAQGVTDLVVNLHHRPASVAAALGDGADLGVRVRYSWEDPVLGSAGGPRHALPLLIDPAERGARRACLVVNGDTLTDLRLDALLDRHRSSGALVTMALVPNPRPDAYGGVEVVDGWVRAFTRRGGPPEARHFIGVQVVEEAALADLPDGVPAETVMGLYPRLLAARPDAIAAHVVNASFHDIGTPRDYLETSLLLARAEGSRLADGAGVDIAPDARLERTAVWNRVAVGPGAHVEECILCDDVRVPPGAALRRCAVVQYAGQPLRDGDRIEGELLLRAF